MVNMIDLSHIDYRLGEHMKDKIVSEVFDYIRLIAIVLVITTLLNTLVFAFSTVKQSSMEHTLNERDVLIVEKLTVLFREPQHGDIVVFVEDETVADSFLTKVSVLYDDMLNKIRGKDQRERLVKRVIGIPGDEINIEDGFVYVNGEKQDEAYVEDLTFAKVLDYPYTVREGHYFVMGDNRDVSKDSRHFGDVHSDHIEGRAMFRISPLSSFGIVN